MKNKELSIILKGGNKPLSQNMIHFDSIKEVTSGGKRFLLKFTFLHLPYLFLEKLFFNSFTSMIHISSYSKMKPYLATSKSRMEIMFDKDKSHTFQSCLRENLISKILSTAIFFLIFSPYTERRLM